MTHKIKNLRWLIAGLLFLITVINLIDRQALSVLAPKLSKDLNISEIGYGNVVQAFLVAYTIFYAVSGVLIDRWGVKFAYGAATAWWSVAAMLNALARSVWDLGIFQFLLAVGEAFNFIACQKVAAEWYPPKERALLNGFSNAAAGAGTIVAPLLIVPLMLIWSWRVAFVVVGSLGLLWLIPWILLYYPPASHPRITAAELELVQPAPSACSSPEKVKVRWAGLLNFRQTWGLLTARAVSDPLWWFYLFWLPKYLTQSRGMSMKLMGSVIWIPYLASDLGSVIGGWYSGRLVGRNWNTLRARKIVMLFSAIVMPLGIMIVLTKSQIVAIALMCVVLFAHMSWKTNLMTLTVDVFPKSVVGSVAGFLATGSGIGGIAFTSTAGYIIKNYSYKPLFVAMGFMHISAYFIVRWLVRGEAAFLTGTAADR